MKKNIIIVLLAFITILSVGFAYVQKLEADRQTIVVLESKIKLEEMTALAKEAKDMAQEQMIAAEHQAAEASHQMQIAIEQLNKTKK